MVSGREKILITSARHYDFTWIFHLSFNFYGKPWLNSIQLKQSNYFIQMYDVKLKQYISGAFRCFPTVSSELIFQDSLVWSVSTECWQILWHCPPLPFPLLLPKKLFSCDVYVGDTGRHNGNTSLCEQVSHSRSPLFASLKRHKVSKPPYLIPSRFHQKQKKQKTVPVLYYAPDATAANSLEGRK